MTDRERIIQNDTEEKDERDGQTTDRGIRESGRK